KAEALAEAKWWLRGLSAEEAGTALAALQRGEVRPLADGGGGPPRDAPARGGAGGPRAAARPGLRGAPRPPPRPARNRAGRPPPGSPAPVPHETEPMPPLVARHPGPGRRAVLTPLAADFRGAGAAGTPDRAAGSRAVGTLDRAATGRPRALPLRDPTPRSPLA